jgi:outer membrane protein
MVNRSAAFASAAALALMTAFAAAPVSAETLQEAIALAYRTNPTLLAQRANQRALDETYVQARAGLRPTLSANVGVDYSRSETNRITTTSPGSTLPIDIDGDGAPDATGIIAPSTVTSGGVVENDGASAGISLSQTIWSGGRIARGVNAAEASILAGRENLRDIEQEVIRSVVEVYVGVQRDLEVLRIREENVTVLRRQLEEATARFEVGEITRTDVAQAEARLAQSDADLANARAQLSVSRAAYAAVVGQAPTTLETPPALTGLPADFDSALDVALVENPGIIAALFNQQGAELRVAQARSEYLPSARLTASYGGSGDLSGFDIGERTSFTAGASISVPLFTGGLNSSRVAQALEQANAAQINVEGERRTVMREVATAYAQLTSARSNLIAGEEAVRAARIASEGVRQEAQVGLRTTLDVLNQELELRSAEVTLANARSNEYAAQAALLAAMGRLSGADLDASLDAYDPADNFRRVRNRGALPWDGVIEALDGIAAPPVVPANDQVDAPIDAQLKSEVIQTAPRN